MRNKISRMDMVKFGFLAILTSVGMAVDLILFGCGIILSLATVTVPFVICASGLFYSLLRLNIMEFSYGTYCERLSREVNAKAAKKQNRAPHVSKSRSVYRVANAKRQEQYLVA